MAKKQTYTYKDLAYIVGVDESTIRRHAKALDIWPVNGQLRPSLIAKQDAQLIIDDDYGPGAGIKKNRSLPVDDDESDMGEALRNSEDHNTQMTIYELEANHEPERSYEISPEFKAALLKNKECTVLDYVHEVINITKDPTIPDKFKELALRAAVNVILGLKEDKPS